MTTATGTSAPIWAYPGFNYVSKTSTYSAVVNDFVQASGAFTVTLPAASGNGGKSIAIKNINTSLITVGVTGGDSIECRNYEVRYSK